MFDAITIDRIHADERNVLIDNTNTYLLSYIEFIKYFRLLPNLTRHNLIIGINFVYGWMPTAFDFRSTQFEESLSILNSVRENTNISIAQLQILKNLFNNSLIGTSKLLHFINPEVYPIWDSRVYRYLTNERPHTYRLEKPDVYLSYQKKCAELTKNAQYDLVHRSMTQKIGYDITRLRSIELIMFYNGAK